MSAKSRKKPQSRGEKNKKNDANIFYWITLVGFGILLFYPPFFRGLFFKIEQQWTLLLAATIFFACCLWKLSKQDYGFLYNILGYAAFGFLLAYVIAFFGAADQHLAVGEIIRMALNFFVFWVAGQLVWEKTNARKIITVLYLSGLCVAAAGFLSVVGAISIKDGFVDGRIYSTLQYPNALAVYLAALLCFGFYLWLTSSGWRSILFATGNFIMTFVLIGTNSRGGFLVFPGMLFLYFLGISREQKIPWLGHVLLIAPVAMLCAGKAVPAAAAENYGPAWTWFLMGMLAIAAVHWLGGRIAPGLRSRFLGLSKKKVVAVAALCIVILAGTAVFLVNNSVDSSQAASNTGEPEQAWYFKVLPEYVAQRIATINLETQSAQDRIYWTYEALDLVKLNPVFGFGGGAWEAAYRQFQDYPYNSTQVHNNFLQIWTEVGTIGLVLYLAVWLSFLLACWRNFRSASDEKDKLIDLSLFVAAAGLGIHSFIDFDLTLSAVSILLWVCFGLSWGRDLKNQACLDKSTERKRSRKQIFIIATSLMAIIFFALPASLLLSNASIKEAVAFAQANNLESAEKSFKQAARLDPFYGEIRATLASIEKVQNNKEETIKYMEEAIKKSPYNFSLYSSLADIYLYYGDVEAAVEAGKKSAACAPWVISAYQSLTEAYVQGGIDCLSQGDIEGAKAYFKECSSLPEVLNDKAGNIPEKAKAIWDQKEAFFNFNSRINMNIGVSQLYLGQFPKAQEYLAKAYEDEEMKPEAGFWLAVLFQKTGMEDEAQNYLVDADQKLKARFQNLIDLSVISGGEEN